MSAANYEISVKELSSRYDPKTLPYETTEELPPEEGVIGQQRAVRALDFALQMKDRGYNIYVSGVPGTGKSSIIKSMIRKVADTQPTPEDWCFVNNFHDPTRPKALSLPAGTGRAFQQDVDHLIDGLRDELPKVFRSEDYHQQRHRIEEGFTKARNSLTHDLEEKAREMGFLLQSSALGIAVIPLYGGKPISDERLAALEPSVRSDIDRKEKELHEHVHTFAHQVRSLRDDMNRSIDELNHRVARYTSQHAFETLRGKYRDHPKVLEHLLAVEEDIPQNLKDFLPEQETPIELPAADIAQARKSVTRYLVNVVVDNGETQGAPLIEETNPTYNNLVGRIERKSQFGALYTDFTLIKAGSILQANGGYLLVHALDVLRSPFSWEAIKRIIKNRELKIEDIGELYGLVTSSTLKPDAIPIRVRLVLVGNPFLFYLLHAYDEDFGKIFKVKADFDVQQERQEDSPIRYGRFISRLCREEALCHFDRGGVAALLDQVSRWVGHQKKLSLRFSDLADLVREADFWARQEKASLVSRHHVQKAIREKIQRSNLLEDRLRELIAEGTLMVDVDGEVVGQVNGLSVYDLGDFVFGRPSRITARVFLGQGGIVNIEREAKLSGKTHSKGVLILSGYLGGCYAGESPLSLSASICFEQSYGEVEGDSASAAELLALLSSLAEIPIRQGIAVTGSVNQRGELQAVGGINEKIEGFYSVCRAVGLTDRQGVLIPRANLKHLMLNDEVVEAAASNRFHIYAASTIDEALEILTGCPAGTRQKDGSYPEGTFNVAVMTRLDKMAEIMRELGPSGSGLSISNDSESGDEPA